MAAAAYLLQMALQDLSKVLPYSETQIHAETSLIDAVHLQYPHPSPYNLNLPSTWRPGFHHGALRHESHILSLAYPQVPE